jgi:hypothetical protein
MKPKEFIQIVLIDEMQDVVFRHQFLSFALISIGIEYLGKCMLMNYNTWNIPPDKAFKSGMKLMSAVDSRYSQVKLKDLQNGFAHTLAPKGVYLSEVKHGALHFGRSNDGHTILVTEIFYRDFVLACNMVLNTSFPPGDKMNKGFLRIGNF